MRGGLTRLTVVASAILALLIGLAFAVLLFAINDMREASEARRQSRTALVEAGNFEKLLIDLETGMRGFVITKEDRFLEPWEAARTALPAESQRFVRAADTEEQRRLALDITQAGTSYLRDYSVPLVDAAQRGDPYALGLQATDEGKRRLDALRAQLDRYDRVELSRIMVLQKASDDVAERAVVGASVGLGASAILISVFTWYLTRAIVRPVRRAAAVAGRLADGDLAARMPETGPGEIGELEIAFNTMGGSLAESSERIEMAHTRLKLLYDASVAVGTTLDVERTARELAEMAIPRFADFVTVDLAVPVLRGEEPPTGDPAKLRRVAISGIRTGSPLFPAGAPIPMGPATAHSFGYARAALVPDLRASTAWQREDPERARKVLDYGIHSLITAPLRARGVTMGVVTFLRSQKPEPFEEEELRLAEDLAAKAAVAIDNARRYTHERATALTLQRSLLPRRIPEQAGVEVASRYLPAGAQAGVGADWFDVIPLSGSRVALVVGDVVGHGIQASATMGWLRSAVRTLADVDLPPDELLTHLDDLVLHRIGDEQPSSAEYDTVVSGDVGATCLYAVYDPISRCCTLATAGHPLPLVVTPGGDVEAVSGHIGPPLGIGGLPFESTEVELAAGSVLALYTDGLIASRARDIDQGLALLRQALALPAASLEAACDTVTDALLTDRPTDDVALLLARTRALPPDQVATWDVPADPAQVERARKLATAQLEAWGMEEAEFITELVVSELVTNAIRYGALPIQLRLIRDRTLICEVSDTSSTAPHLRRSRALDEGGRGLLLVAQLTQGWGTRQTTTGKTIWCEQPLPAP
ncbi:SpoIIE family protein phosphatase [Streptomyces sp. NPDC000880]